MDACAAAAATYLNVEYDALGWGTPVPSGVPDGYRFIVGNIQDLTDAPRAEELASCTFESAGTRYPAVVIVRVTGETVLVAVEP
jgi:hypothetical protein